MDGSPKTGTISKNMNEAKQHPASFRDPAGFVFQYQQKFYRQINQCFAGQYNLFKSSGLYSQLVKEQKILAHTESDINILNHPDWYITLLPEQLSCIAYPYEWCFEQWKAAALFTLSLVKKSVAHGMILKDATPFNIQFIGRRPVFIDSLSFEKYDAGKPWTAYRQFIECFIAPLLLAKYLSPQLLKIFQLHPAGIPLSLLEQMLPFKSRFNLNVWMHIFLPGAVAHSKKNDTASPKAFTEKKLLHIIHNLESFVNSIHIAPAASNWNNYYEETVLSEQYVTDKKNILSQWIDELPVDTVLDMGTNTGLFAEMTADKGKFTIAVDADIACISKLYSVCRTKKINNLLPLCLDISNPSPAIGWRNEERTDFFSRVHTDLCMALALVHHLAINSHIQFDKMAELFAALSPWLIIEFVPKTDAKVLLLLQHRQDIFSSYSEENFIEAFKKKFTIINRAVPAHTGRVLFLMKRISQQAGEIL